MVVSMTVCSYLSFSKVGIRLSPFVWNKSRTKLFLLLFLLQFSAISNSFAKDFDTGAWIDLAATKKIHAVTFGLIGEYYFSENISTIERTSIGLKCDGQLFPWLSAGAGYLLMNFKRPGYLELRNRYYFQMEPSWHLSKFYFCFRERMQATFFPETRSATPDNYYWRNRFEVCYENESWKIQPLIDLESFYLLKELNVKLFDEFRFLGGANLLLSKNQKLKCYGMYSKGTLLNRFIIGVAYDIRL